MLIADHGARTRVYVHPDTLAILKTQDESNTLERAIFKLHGELMLGENGSYLVELAASWAIVMILTGLYLWWPRNAKGLGGVLYPRLGQGPKRFWRDLHAVVGIWVSAFALFLLASGLPWASVWGAAFKNVRAWTGTAPISSGLGALQRRRTRAAHGAGWRGGDASPAWRRVARCDRGEGARR